MNILFVISSSNFGGAERYLETLTEDLRKRGHNLFVYRNSFGTNEDVLKRNVAEDIVTSIKNSVSPFHIYRMLRMIKKHHISVIHTHLSKASVLGGIAGHMACVPSVGSVHGLNRYKDYRFNTHMIAVSDTVRSGLIKSGAPEKDITVVYNGVPECHNKGIDKYDDDLIRILFAGRLSHEKGADLLIKAMASLGNGPWRLQIAGRGVEMEDLKKMTLEYGLQKRVEFLGFVEDIRERMARSDLVVQPSRKEGFGLSAAEAFSCAVPVIASDAGGLKEVVQDGVNGFVFPSGDHEKLAEAIKKASDRKTRLNMGNNAYNTYRNKFSVDLMSERTLAVYEKVIGNTHNNT